MKASVLKLTLVSVCTLACALSAAAVSTGTEINNNIERHTEKAKIGLALPVQHLEGEFLRQAFRTRGYDVTLYNTDLEQNQIPRMLEDGCNIIIVGAENGYELDPQMEEAQAHGIKVMAYGSMLTDADKINMDPVYVEGRYTGAALNLEPDTSDSIGRIELFSGVVMGTGVSRALYSALTVINPYIESGALLVNADYENQILPEQYNDSLGKFEALMARYADQG